MKATLIAQIDIYDNRYNDGTLQAVMENYDNDADKINWLQENCACENTVEDLDFEFGEVIIDVPGYQVYYYDYGMSEGIKLYKLLSENIGDYYFVYSVDFVTFTGRLDSVLMILDKSELIDVVGTLSKQKCTISRVNCTMYDGEGTSVMDRDVTRLFNAKQA